MTISVEAMVAVLNVRQPQLMRDITQMLADHGIKASIIDSLRTGAELSMSDARVVCRHLHSQLGTTNMAAFEIPKSPLKVPEAESFTQYKDTEGNLFPTAHAAKQSNAKILLAQLFKKYSYDEGFNLNKNGLVELFEKEPSLIELVRIFGAMK